MSSTIETRLEINAVSRDIEGNHVEVAYLPPVYIGIKEVVFTNLASSAMPTAFLDVYGLPQVLEHLTVGNNVFNYFFGKKSLVSGRYQGKPANQG